MTKQTYHLISPQIRHNACQAIMQAPEGMVVQIKEKTRSLEQNARLHALFSEVSRQSSWCGRKMNPEQWKVLFISGHSQATGNGADMIPGLENEYVNIRESSASMTIARMSSLIEYIHAWCADNNVRVS